MQGRLVRHPTRSATWNGWESTTLQRNVGGWFTRTTISLLGPWQSWWRRMMMHKPPTATTTSGSEAWCRASVGPLWISQWWEKRRMNWQENSGSARPLDHRPQLQVPIELKGNDEHPVWAWWNGICRHGHWHQQLQERDQSPKVPRCSRAPDQGRDARHCGRGECDHPFLDIICIPHHRHSSISRLGWEELCGEARWSDPKGRQVGDKTYLCVALQGSKISWYPIRHSGRCYGFSRHPEELWYHGYNWWWDVAIDVWSCRQPLYEQSK